MPKIRSPKYRCQKRSTGDLAFVEIVGVRRYLGTFNSPESLNAYHRAVAEWIEGGRSKLLPATTQEITVGELVAKYREHADVYYRKADGTPRTEIEHYRQACTPIPKLYVMLRVLEFGPRALKTVREKMETSGKLNRKTINGYTTRIKSLFKWGVEQEIIPPSTWHGLQALAGLRRGRTTAMEPKRVLPVLQAHIDAVLPHVSRQVWAIIQLQLFAAARADAPRLCAQHLHRPAYPGNRAAFHGGTSHRRLNLLARRRSSRTSRRRRVP